jgi:hypothetical protein
MQICNTDCTSSFDPFFHSSYRAMLTGLIQSKCTILHILPFITHVITSDVVVTLVSTLSSLRPTHAHSLSVVAYSLWSACWVSAPSNCYSVWNAKIVSPKACQWGTPYPSNNPATYGTFLGAGLVGSTGVLCPNGLDIGVFV